MNLSGVILPLLAILGSVSARSRKVDTCTCLEEGNYYTTLADQGCRAFTQRTRWLPAVRHRCPPGLLFDVNRCTCNWRWRVVCPTSCVAPLPARQDPEPAMCTARGNVYKPLPRTSCTRYTQTAPNTPPYIMNCAPGLKFDVKLCTCNWPQQVTCEL